MDGTYAPQSPDLSNFLSSPSKTQQPYHQSKPVSASTAAYAPRSPIIPSFNNPAVAPTSQHNLHAPYPSPQYHPFGGGVGGGGYGEVLPPDTNLELDVFGNAQYMPPIPSLPPQHSFPSQLLPQTQTQTQPQASPPYFQQQHQQPQPYLPFKTEDSYSAPDFNYATSPAMTSRQPRGGHHQSLTPAAPSQPPPFQQQYKDPNPNNIEIKTKFPVARIKRIMQADEEVGKVAQVTPVAVSKALELFMIALVSGAADKAKEKGGKRVTAQHLKQVVLGSPEQFDFLAEIVGRVAEVQEGNTDGGGGGPGSGVKRRAKKSEEGSESSAEEEKKVKKGKGRRKKSDD